MGYRLPLWLLVTGPLCGAAPAPLAALVQDGGQVVGPRAQVVGRGGDPSTAPQDTAALEDAHDLIDHPLGFARAFASDGWATVAGPFRLRGDDAWKLAGVLGAGALLLAFDEPIYEAMVESAEDGVGRQVERFGDLLDPVSSMGKTNQLWVAGMIASDLVGQEELEVMFKELFFAHALGGMGRKGVGRPIGRLRPEQEEGAYARRFWEGTSFPSGHTSTICRSPRSSPTTSTAAPPPSCSTASRPRWSTSASRPRSTGLPTR